MPRDPEKQRAAKKRWAQQNKEKARASKAAWNARNPGYLRSHYQAHKDTYSQKAARYRQANKDQIREAGRQYYVKNADRIKARAKQWRLDNPERFKARTKAYQAANVARGFCATHPTRKAVRYGKCKRCILVHELAQKVRKSLASTTPYDFGFLGCSVSELKAHLEAQFSSGMSWANMGTWHIDHIVPLATAEDEAGIKALWHYTNLRPMWAEDNEKKSSYHNGQYVRGRWKTGDGK